MGASGSKSWAGKLACLASPPLGLCPPGPAAAAVQHLAARCGPGWGLGRSWAVPGEVDQNCLQERTGLREAQALCETITAPRPRAGVCPGGLGIAWARRRVAAGPSLKREGRAGRLPAALRRKARPGDYWGLALGVGWGPHGGPTLSHLLPEAQARF